MLLRIDFFLPLDSIELILFLPVDSITKPKLLWWSTLRCAAAMINKIKRLRPVKHFPSCSSKNKVLFPVTLFSERATLSTWKCSIYLSTISLNGVEESLTDRFFHNTHTHTRLNDSNSGEVSEVVTTTPEDSSLKPPSMALPTLFPLASLSTTTANKSILELGHLPHTGNRDLLMAVSAIQNAGQEKEKKISYQPLVQTN